jgi:hypothetical protein
LVVLVPSQWTTGYSDGWLARLARPCGVAQRRTDLDAQVGLLANAGAHLRAAHSLDSPCSIHFHDCLNIGTESRLAGSGGSEGKTIATFVSAFRLGPMSIWPVQVLLTALA